MKTFYRNNNGKDVEINIHEFTSSCSMIVDIKVDGVAYANKAEATTGFPFNNCNFCLLYTSRKMDSIKILQYSRSNSR